MIAAAVLGAALSVAGAPSDDAATPDWRWRASWALAADFDLDRDTEEIASVPSQALRVERGAPGFPPGAQGSTLRSTQRRVLRSVLPGRPEPLLEYRGSAEAPIRGLALGPRGLLVFVDEPELGGPAVLELRYRPASEYPFRIGHEPRVRSDAEARGHAVMAKAGCFSCHSLHGRRQAGPSLDRESLVPRLRARLHSGEYRERIAELDAREPWPLRRWREERREVLAASGMERLRVWMKWHLVEPSFDEPGARMPSMGLRPQEIRAVTDFLLGSVPDDAARSEPRR